MPEIHAENEDDDQKKISDEESDTINRKNFEKMYALLGKHCSMLSEHFDTVHIFVTRHHVSTDGDNTFSTQRGEGNFYARVGQVREWLTKCEEDARLERRSREN